MPILAPLLALLFTQAQPRREKEPPPKPTVEFVVKLVDRKFDPQPPHDGTATLAPDARGGASEAVTVPIRANRFEFEVPDERRWAVTRLEFGDLHVHLDLVRVDRGSTKAPVEIRATVMAPLVLHVVAAETGKELDDVELSSSPHPVLPSRPLESRRVRGADGGTSPPLRSPVTIDFDERVAGGTHETILVKVAGRITEAASIDWRADAEVKVALSRAAGFTVRIENFEMPKVERPEDMSEEMFRRTLRPHIAIREFKESTTEFGSGGLGSKRQLRHLESVLKQPAPDSIREEARADFLATLRLSCASLLTEHDPGIPYPIDADGRARIEDRKPGRYLVTLEVHDPFHDEMDNFVHRFEWMTFRGRPLAAALAEVSGSDGEEAMLRVPPAVSEARGTARFRFVDAQTGHLLSIASENVFGRAIRPYPRLRDSDASSRLDELRVTVRRDGDDFVMEGLAGCSSLSEVRLEPPWYMPVNTFVELRPPPEAGGAAPEAPIVIPIARVTGVVVEWRDAKGPLDWSKLVLIRSEPIEAVDAEGRRCEEFHSGGKSLFVVPGGGRCTLKTVSSGDLRSVSPAIERVEGGTLGPDGATFDVAAGGVCEAIVTFRLE